MATAAEAQLPAASPPAVGLAAADGVLLAQRSLDADVAAWVLADVADHAAFLAAHTPDLPPEERRSVACRAISACFNLTRWTTTIVAA